MSMFKTIIYFQKFSDCRENFVLFASSSQMFNLYTVLSYTKRTSILLFVNSFTSRVNITNREQKIYAQSIYFFIYDLYYLWREIVARLVRNPIPFYDQRSSLGRTYIFAFRQFHHIFKARAEKFNLYTVLSLVWSCCQISEQFHPAL